MPFQQNRGGAEIYIRNLVQSLKQICDENEYIIYAPTSIANEIVNKPGKLNVVGIDIGFLSPIQRLIWDQITLRNILLRDNFDILFSSSDFGMLFPPCKQLLFIRNALFFSNTYNSQILPKKSLKYRIYFRLQRLLIGLSIRSADMIMTASYSMLKTIKSTYYIPVKKTTVNYFGTPFDKLGIYEDKNNNEFKESDSDLITNKKVYKILYVSEYADYKNFSVLLKAIKYFADHGYDNIRFILTINLDDLEKVETNTYHEDKQLLEDDGVKKITSMTGYLPYEKINELYIESDIFVFPSLVESYGHPLVEAMKSGLPVIASDTLVNREICDNSAIYFSTDDHKYLADKILLLINNREIRKQLIDKGIETVNDKGNFTTHMKVLTQIFNSFAEDLMIK